MSMRRVRHLRSNSTEAERALWKHLRLRQLENHKFRRQRSVGPFIVDFVCLEKNLVVEVDGGQHDTQRDRDSERTAWLEEKGFTMLRFWNNEVLANVEAVKEAILAKLREL